MKSFQPSGKHPVFEERVRVAMDSLSKDMSTLRVIKFLGQMLPPKLARSAATLHELRLRASTRFPTLSLPFLTRKGLSQASSEVVAKWRAQKFQERAPGTRVLDATCGIGADSIALGIAQLQVVSADLDWEHLLFTRANLEANGLPGHVIQADATLSSALADVCLLDPDRRSGGQRQL
ncbi:MAG: SAM-dependent methyltransferase, partial [Candidatus Paceibacteria bacterium]